MALVSPSGERLATAFSIADLTVDVTPAERAAGAMAEEKAERIAALMREHGAVLLQCSVPLVPHADLDRIGARLEFQSALAAAEGTHMGNSTNQRGNTGAAGFMTSSLPRRAEWVTPSIVANPIIEQAVAACLGRGCFLNTFGTITNHPGSETQDLHMDGTWWKTTEAEAEAVGHPWPYRAHAVNVSFGCDTVTHECGATEFWPGSHFDTLPATTNKPRDPAAHVQALIDGAARRRELNPPIQLTIPKGAVCIRDWRCWHRGVANRTERPRHLLNIGYGAPFVREDLVVGSTLLKNRATPEEQAAAATDTGWEDSFVRFHPDCREMIAGSPSRHGVDRNADFLADVVIPAIPTSQQVDSSAEVVRALPMPMPEGVRGVGWAEEVWRQAGGVAKM